MHQLGKSDRLRIIGAKKIRFCGEETDLNDRSWGRFGADFLDHNREIRSCAGIPAVSQKLLRLGEAFQCQFDRALPGLNLIGKNPVSLSWAGFAESGFVLSMSFRFSRKRHRLGLPLIKRNPVLRKSGFAESGFRQTDSENPVLC